MPADPPPSALILNGSVGAGKTSVAAVIGDILGGQRVPYAVIDLDALRQAWPAPDDDPFNLQLTLANLTAVARNFKAAGAERLVLAGVVESRDQIDAYVRALDGVGLIAVRLHASVETLRQRVIDRRRDSGASLTWHLDRSAELAVILDNADADDLVVPTDGRAITDVAADVVTAVGWSAAN